MICLLPFATGSLQKLRCTFGFWLWCLQAFNGDKCQRTHLKTNIRNQMTDQHDWIKEASDYEWLLCAGLFKSDAQSNASPHEAVGGGVPDFPLPTFKAQAAHLAQEFLCSPSAAAVQWSCPGELQKSTDPARPQCKNAPCWMQRWAVALASARLWSICTSLHCIELDISTSRRSINCTCRSSSRALNTIRHFFLKEGMLTRLRSKFGVINQNVTQWWFFWASC